MRSAWFVNTASSSIPSGLPRAQNEAITKAETLFRHVADTYFTRAQESLAMSAQATTHSTSSTLEPSTASGLLSAACHVTVALAPTTTASLHEAFKEELNQYLKKFEGGRGNLADPLGWWKVCQMYSCGSYLISIWPRKMQQLFRLLP